MRSTVPVLLAAFLYTAGADGLHLLGSASAPGTGGAVDCSISGTRAFVSTATAGGGTEVWDVSNPAAPTLLWAGGPASWRCGTAGDTLLVSWCRENGVFLYDISGPVPVRLGQYDPPGGGTVFEGGDLSGSLLYCAAHDQGICVLDVSDPAAPVRTGGCALPGANAWNLVVDEPYIYTACGSSGLSVIDTRGGLTQAASLDLPGYSSDICLSGNVLIMSLAAEGLATVDVSDPLHPVLMDTAPTDGCLMGIGVGGDLAAAGSCGFLEVYDVGDPGSIVRLARERTEYPAMSADIGSDSLVVSAAWQRILCLSPGGDPSGDIDVDPVVLDFGRGTGVRDTTVTVANEGAGTLDVASVSAPDGFTVVPVTFSLAPGGSRSVAVTAVVAVPASGFITYRSSDPDEPSVEQAVYRNDLSFPQCGSEAPDFSLDGTDGRVHTLSGYRGRVVCLEFGGTRCPTGGLQAAVTDASVHDRYDTTEVAVLEVCPDPGQLAVLASVFGVAFTGLTDPGGTAGQEYRTPDPCTACQRVFVVDQNGIVRYWSDVYDPGRIVRVIDRLLENEGSVDAATDEGSALELHLSPNPAASSVTITAGGFTGPAVVRIFTLTGRIVQRIDLAEPAMLGIETDLPAGVYLVSLTAGDEIASRTLVVTR